MEIKSPKKPENETPDEAIIRRAKEFVTNTATRNEKTSWHRKMNRMVSLIAELQPIEEEIVELLAKKMPVVDKITELRSIMLKDCIHPFTHLVHHDNHIVCKFCEKKFSTGSNLDGKKDG